ncbi:hypothetical protein PR202_gb15980 [Eleusine coracana subsp. coracana]|uniref:SCP domain-containing protein n=1 Tax=Eleusine coracana subsp. coracana TaxID=191504 RepID=A0AAV5F0J7_ELECO|nr:hypothetical protein QOZ80_4BG0352790 [Eleusine coracana subsp. coracana]GJN27915.1 hypothetical protein PR202_gb15980 [Eleusine coracana subsp. coracana]
MSSSFTTLTVLSLVLAMTSLSSSSSPPSEASDYTGPRPIRVPRGVATTAAFLSAINDARGKVGAPSLSWNSTVAQNAKAQVSWLRTSGGCDLGQIKRSPVPQIGGLTFHHGYGRQAPADAVSAWASERQWYDHDAKTCTPGKQCGDYTMVVDPAWKQLGCAVVACEYS